MKTNFMKKTFAVLTAFMTASVLTSAMHISAVDSPTIDSLPAHKLDHSSEIAEIPIKKDIVFFNPEQKRIYEPNIVYQYEIASANVTSANISTKDSADKPVILSVHPGIIQALTAITDAGNADSAMTGNGETRNGTITFGNDNTMKYTNQETAVPYEVSVDYKATRQMNLKIDASKIYDTNTDGIQDNQPGVYRYKITDITTDETYAQSGVTEGSANDSIFLDVYVKNNEDKTGFVIYGYVLLKSTESEDNTSITYNETADETVKIDGFVTTAEGDDDGNEKVIPADFKGDMYKTYNVDIKKEVVGDLADRQHRFPFKIQLSNESIKNSANFGLNDGATHVKSNLSETGSWDSQTASIAEIDFKLKHGQMISLIGLPIGTKVTVTETNDTDNVYSVSASFNEIAKTLKNSDGSKTGTSISVAQNDTAILEDSYLVSLKTTSDKLVMTNTLRDISVTGVLLNIAPFLFITVAGVVLFGLYLRNKKENDSENLI